MNPGQKVPSLIIRDSKDLSKKIVTEVVTRKVLGSKMCICMGLSCRIIIRAQLQNSLQTLIQLDSLSCYQALKLYHYIQAALLATTGVVPLCLGTHFDLEFSLAVGESRTTVRRRSEGRESQVVNHGTNRQDTAFRCPL